MNSPLANKYTQARLRAERRRKKEARKDAEIDSLREEITRLRTELNQQKVYEESMYESLQHALDRGLSLEIAQLDQNCRTVGWSPFNPDKQNLRDWPVSRFRAVPAPAAVPEGWREAISKAIERAKVLDDGGDGADPESARSVVAILTPLLQSAEPASHDNLTERVGNTEFVLLADDPARRSESDNQNEGLEAFDELMRNVLFLNVHERSKLERIVRKHLCESRDDVKAETLEKYIPQICDKVHESAVAGGHGHGLHMDAVSAEVWGECAQAATDDIVARLRGEGSE